MTSAVHWCLYRTYTMHTGCSCRVPTHVHVLVRFEYWGVHSIGAVAGQCWSNALSVGPALDQYHYADTMATLQPNTCTVSATAEHCHWVRPMPATLSSSETTRPTSHSVERKCWPKVVLLLGQRRGHWCNIKPTSAQYPMYVGIRLAISISQAVSGLLWVCVGSAINRIVSRTSIIKRGHNTHLDKLISEYAEIFDQNWDCCVNAAKVVSLSVQRQQRWAKLTQRWQQVRVSETEKCCHNVATVVPMSV